MKPSQGRTIPAAPPPAATAGNGGADARPRSLGDAIAWATGFMGALVLLAAVFVPTIAWLLHLGLAGLAWLWQLGWGSWPFS